MTGVWVIAHECGHQAFSDYKIVNDTVGLILHSMLLVPYHSWRITHRRHHSNTGSCENDEVFNPPAKSEFASHEMFEETPFYRTYCIVRMLTVGWLPGYLVFNATGPAKYRGKNANHFSPTAAMFSSKEYNDVVVSVIMYFAFVGFLVWFTFNYGFITLLKYYLVPETITNAYLVLITYLQHTDVHIPHFRSAEWNWLRGALCTTDRSFGKYLDGVLHHIVDTHVCHHLFSTMPFYHAEEATEAIKKVLGDYYLYDPTPIPAALWRSFANCKYVED